MSADTDYGCGKLSPLTRAADDAAMLIERAMSDISAGDRVSPKDVKEIISCIKDLTAVVRNLNGIPEQIQEEKEIKIIMGNAENYTD